mmetsp:Transcript_9159/g.28434  ORF Transcript_9159/g.28434 Transcript_9159/m.28434 type:complete len:291 (+) Transcript_9159:1724-2596(+)
MAVSPPLAPTASRQSVSSACGASTSPWPYACSATYGASPPSSPPLRDSSRASCCTPAGIASSQRPGRFASSTRQREADERALIVRSGWKAAVARLPLRPLSTSTAHSRARASCAPSSSSLWTTRRPRTMASTSFDAPGGGAAKASRVRTHSGRRICRCTADGAGEERCCRLLTPLGERAGNAVALGSCAAAEVLPKVSGSGCASRAVASLPSASMPPLPAAAAPLPSAVGLAFSFLASACRRPLAATFTRRLPSTLIPGGGVGDSSAAAACEVAASVGGSGVAVCSDGTE